MPEFILDTSGTVDMDTLSGPEGANLNWLGVALRWSDLTPFTQGYIEALFFTEEESMNGEASPGGYIEERSYGVRFDDLAPEALAAIICDCRKFQDCRAWADATEGCDEAQAGRDFWYTRNGRGCGFWDGDWPEPHGDALTSAAKAFGECDVYLGDDGKVHLS